jgi:heme/copper-type cytochrome/quinol oxidase subunit 1
VLGNTIIKQLISKIIELINKIVLNIKNIISLKKDYIITKINSRKFILKKYFYTINHKKLGLYYFYFSLWTGCSGALLATMIRLEMAYPGSPFFKGDSLRYLQVMTAHALIMIFFVVVPIFFGGFANFLLPYHVGSKDVAFPRLNSIGFWIQPCGYLLIAKIGFIRQQYWHYYDKSSFYFPMIDLNKYDKYIYSSNSGKNFKKIQENKFIFYIKYKYFNSPEDRMIFNFYDDHITSRWEKRHSKIAEYTELRKEQLKENFGPDKNRIYTDYELDNLIPIKPIEYIAQLTKKLYNTDDRLGFLIQKEKPQIFNNNNEFMHFDYTSSLTVPVKIMLWKNLINLPENFWYLGSRVSKLRRKKRFVAKCASPTQTVAGWTFITPFSSNVRFTGYGVQDMLITGIYFAGISTTISLTNLLVTRRTLSMPGLRNRRILLPFTSITILLMLRALAIITPVLGSAMLMLLLDRHWKTSFFDFSYGGDPILFHHLFWFFGHPEVYVLVIPAFGVINVILPYNNVRRIASKHHLIWAIYIMNYMGFLVWGHHMYLIGLDHRSRALYSTLTIMISLPATIKVVNWTFSLINGTLKVDAAFYAAISFIFFFLVAGFTGMWLSHVSLDISMHDTLYVVAHFHLMLSGAVVMSIFAGFYYYFFTFFNIKYSRTWAYLHLIYYTGGQWLTFLPLFWVSFSGLPRRLHDFPAVFTGWQSMATAGHFVTMTGVFFFYITIYDSHKEKKLGTPLNFMIPRINKRVLYYLHKIVFLKNEKEKFNNLPNKKTRIYIINNCSINKEFEVLNYKSTV